MERTSSLIEAATGGLEAPAGTAAPPKPSCVAKFGGFILGLCYWAMLAASTIGPGTITLMAKGGAEMAKNREVGDACLSWTIIAASVVAYTLQEGAARLQILTDTSFGAAMYVHLVATDGTNNAPSTLTKLLGTSRRTPALSMVMAVLIIIANTVLECAQVAGMMAAVQYYGGSGVFTRAMVSFVVCTIVAVTLFKGNLDAISKALGAVVALMAVVFSVSASATDLGPSDYVPAMPAEAADQALGMIATTAIPFNVFLASSLAQGYTLSEMRVGVQFSTLVTAVLSLLLVITGTAVTMKTGVFQIQDLAHALGDLINHTAEAFFVGGLVAASMSSALTVAMGAALACQSLLSGGDDALAMAQDAATSAAGINVTNTVGDQDGEGAAAAIQRTGSVTDPTMFELAEALREVLHLPTLQTITQQLSFTEQMSAKNQNGDLPIDGAGGALARQRSGGDSGAPAEESKWLHSSPRFKGVILWQLFVAFIVVTCGLPTVGVIMLSQVVGGMLLPTISYCLLLVMNSPKLVRLRQTTDGRPVSDGAQDGIYNGIYVISGIIAAAMLIASMRVVLGAEEAATAELRRLRGGD